MASKTIVFWAIHMSELRVFNSYRVWKNEQPSLIKSGIFSRRGLPKWVIILSCERSHACYATQPMEKESSIISVAYGTNSIPFIYAHA